MDIACPTTIWLCNHCGPWDLGNFGGFGFVDIGLD